MKLIVTGAAGAPGTAVANLLEQAGHDVARIAIRAAPEASPTVVECEDLAQPEQPAPFMAPSSQ